MLKIDFVSLAMMALECSNSSVQNFLGEEAYNKLLLAVGKDMSEVNEKLNSKIEEHFQLNCTIAERSMKNDDNKRNRRRTKTSKTQHSVEIGQTADGMMCVDDLQTLVEGYLTHFEQNLENSLNGAKQSQIRLIRAEKGKLVMKHKAQKHDLESAQKRIETLLELDNLTRGERTRESEKQDLITIFSEQTKNLEYQQKLELQGIDYLSERFQKQHEQDVQAFSKAFLHFKLKYCITTKDKFICKENFLKIN